MTDTSQALITHVRDHFVAQFETFVRDRRARHVYGASETKLRLGGNPGAHLGLYCADFMTNEADQGVVDYRSDRVLTFEPVSTTLGGAALTIDSLRWDAAFIHHDLSALPLADIDAWLATWFDPDNRRNDAGPYVKHLVHALTIEPFQLQVDFGTAPPDAFWSLLSVLQAAGASLIRVTATPAERS